MINTKLIVIIAAAVAVVVAAYFTIRPSNTVPAASIPSNADLGLAIPSPQYLHDHPAELQEAKAKCNGSTLPPEPYCTNVRKADELIEADEYKKALGTGSTSK